MTLIAQSFLPIVKDNTNEILGLVSITSTTFTGAETSFTIGTLVYMTKVITVFNSQTEAPTVSYLAISVTDYEYRTDQYLSISGFLDISFFLQQENWITIKGFSGNSLSLNQTQLKTILATGTMKIPGSVVIPGPVIPTMPRIWNMTAPLATSQACTFFDLAFTDTAMYVAGVPALSIALSTPVPAGIIENYLKIYTFQDPGIPMVLGGMSNTMRFIKLTAAVIPAGIYSYQVTASLLGGATELVTLNLTIV